MRIALAQTDTAQGDFEKNLEKISDFAKAAKDGGAQIAVFPEMCVCGFDYKKNLDEEIRRGEEKGIAAAKIKEYYSEKARDDIKNAGEDKEEFYKKAENRLF